jgi:hypothetical protein
MFIMAEMLTALLAIMFLLSQIRDALFFSMFFGVYEIALQRSERYESVPKGVSVVCAGN